jgi:hypothetical protein
MYLHSANGTLHGSGSECPKDQALHLTTVSYSKKNKLKLEYKREKKDHVGGFGNNPIYPLLSTWTSTCTEPEALYE